jgi:hypothetical protein
MKKRLYNISNYFKIEKLKNDKRIVVFMVCILIATGLWFLNALNKDYLATISYPVKYVNAPQNQFLANEPPSKLDLKVNAHGFTLLRHKLSLSFSPIVLNLTTMTQNMENSEDGFVIYTGNLIQRISNQISNEIKINYIQPEILRIKLDSLKTKMVRVKENIDMDFKSQFDLKEGVILSPNEIEITGPAAVIDTINFLFTREETFEKLDADVVTTIEIIHPEKTSVTPDKVTLKIPIEKFTEKDITIPIQIQNKPVDTNLKLFPSVIELTVLVGLSEFEHVDGSKFDVFVDFEKADSNSENLSVSVLSNVSHLKIIRFSPKTVEYLIETK